MRKKMGFLMIAIVAVISFQCSTEQDNVSVIQEQYEEDLSVAAPEIYDFLICQGFNLDEAKLFEHHVLVEGDVAIPLDAINAMIEDGEQSISNGRAEQYVVARYPAGTGVVGYSNVSNIQYFIDNSVGTALGTDWEDAIHDGLQDWESITSCRISFAETTIYANADIRFFSDTSTDIGLPTCARNISTPAAAEFPTWLQPGSYISIDNAFAAASQGNRETIIRHEVGHTLGFRHDNSGSEGVVSCGRTIGFSVKLTGTPTVESSSVMNSDINTSTIRDFTSNDKKAARYLYPNGYSAPVVSSLTQHYNSSSTKNIKVTMSSPSLRMYRYNFERLTPWSSTPVETVESVGSSTNTFWMYNVPHGTWRFRIKGLNYHKDAFAESSYQTLVVQ